MTEVVEGSLNGSGLHIGVAAASWNPTITDRLLDGAVSRLRSGGVDEVTVMRVPGALELPVAARHLVDHGCDGVVAIGAVIKGDTDHYDIVVRESTRGLTLVSVETGVPVTNAILAVHDVADAVARAGEGESNKGHEAAEAVIVTATAIDRLRTLDE